MKKYPIKLAVALAILLTLISCKPNKQSGIADNHVNVIVIMADDLGYETIGANGGSSYPTPELDRMAANGMRFEHCYAQPLCTPSRVQIMTGIYNVRNYIRFGLLDESQTTFGHLFRTAGYATCIIGKWQLGKDVSSPRKAGFEKHCLWQVGEGRMDSSGRDTRYSMPVLAVDGVVKKYAETEYGPEVVSEYGLEFIEESFQNGKPFLLYYPMILTHCPFSPTPDSPEWIQDDSTVLTYKGQPHYFEDMMGETDRIIGKIARKLEKLGIQNNTLILFTGDNGTDKPIVSVLKNREVAGAKGQSTDAGTRVPLIVQWRGVVEAGSIDTSLIDFSDFLPTICEAADIEIPDSLDIDGRSFLPQIRGENGKAREWIYSWYSRQGEVSEARVFARNHRYKLYESGEFYEVPRDYKELNPLKFEELDPEAKGAYQMLEDVLDKYEDLRLDKIPSSGLEEMNQ